LIGAVVLDYDQGEFGGDPIWLRDISNVFCPSKRHPSNALIAANTSGFCLQTIKANVFLGAKAHGW